MGTSNVVPFARRRSKANPGDTALVLIETLSAIVSMYERIGAIPLDYTIGQPCACAFCALRAENAVWFRRTPKFETLGNVGFSEHLK